LLIRYDQYAEAAEASDPEERALPPTDTRYFQQILRERHTTKYPVEVATCSIDLVKSSVCLREGEGENVFLDVSVYSSYMASIETFWGLSEKALDFMPRRVTIGNQNDPIVRGEVVACSTGHERTPPCSEIAVEDGTQYVTPLSAPDFLSASEAAQPTASPYGNGSSPLVSPDERNPLLASNEGQLRPPNDGQNLNQIRQMCGPSFIRDGCQINTDEIGSILRGQEMFHDIPCVHKARTLLPGNTARIDQAMQIPSNIVFDLGIDSEGSLPLVIVLSALPKEPDGEQGGPILAKQITVFEMAPQDSLREERKAKLESRILSSIAGDEGENYSTNNRETKKGKSAKLQEEKAKKKKKTKKKGMAKGKEKDKDKDKEKEREKDKEKEKDKQKEKTKGKEKKKKKKEKEDEMGKEPCAVFTKLPSLTVSKQVMVMEIGNTIHCLETKDLYGFENAGALECVVCLVEDSSTTLLPCRHTNLCFSCLKQLDKTICPVCRSPFKSFLRWPATDGRALPSVCTHH